jgi:hypothetical protein
MPQGLGGITPEGYPVTVNDRPVRDRLKFYHKKGVFTPSSDCIPSADGAFPEQDKNLPSYVLPFLFT